MAHQATVAGNDGVRHTGDLGQGLRDNKNGAPLDVDGPGRTRVMRRTRPNRLAGSVLKVWLYGALARRVLTSKPTFTEVREGAFRKWWAAAAAELGADVVDLEQGFCRISKGGRSTILQEHFLSIDTYMNLKLVGNKPFVHWLLRSHGYRVPRYVEFTLSELEKAWEFMQAVGGRCVVKPSSGSGGFGVTTGVNSRKRLRQAAIASATASYQQVPMIEEEFDGDSYRLLFLDGKLIDAVKRCRPTVIGDGKSTIRQLIDGENKQRLGSGPSRAHRASASSRASTLALPKRR